MVNRTVAAGYSSSRGSVYPAAPARTGLFGVWWPWLNAAAFWLAVVLRTAEEYLLFRPSADALMHLSSTFHFQRGNGISLASMNWADWGSLHFTSLAAWPPGMPWLLALLLPELATDADILLAHSTIYFGSIVLLFGAWWYMLRSLAPTLQAWAPAAFFLFWGISNAPFHLLHNTDLPALACCCAGLACLLRLLAGPTAGRWKRAGLLLGMAGLSFGACMFRFSYYPLAFLPALVLLACWWRGKRRAAVAALLVTCLLVAALVTYQKIIAGNAYYLTEMYADPAWKIYFSNLRHFLPFPVEGLFGELALPPLAAWAGALLLLGLCLAGAWQAYDARKQHPARFWFFALCLLVGGGSVAVLVVTSLRYPPAIVHWFAGPWTYVGVARYFGPAMLMVSALLLVLALSRQAPMRLRVPVVVVLALALANALLLRAKNVAFLLRHPGPPAAFFADKYEGTTTDARRAVQVILQAERRGTVLLTTDTYAYRLEEAVMARSGAVASLDTLLRTPARTSKPVTLLLAAADGQPSANTAAFLRRFRPAAPPVRLPSLHLLLYTVHLPARTTAR